MIPTAPKKQSGVTLIEMLLVVGIIAVLSGAMIPGFSNYTRSQNLRQGQEQFKNDLSSALNNALTGVLAGEADVNYWGIRVPQNASGESGVYEFFTAGTANNCSNVVVRRTSTRLPADTVVKGSNICVYFSKRNGDAIVVRDSSVQSLPANIRIGYANTTTGCVNVAVNAAGQVKAPASVVACN